MNAESASWWSREVHGDRRARLLARARIKDALRGYFAREGFVEVECPALQRSPGNEAHLHAFRSELVTTDGRRAAVYLHTSPEFTAKKLIAAGERRIFDFARVFRNRERTALHHPEFTLLEWYRAEEPYTRLMEDCAAVLRLAAEAAGSAALLYRGRSCDPLLAPERVTVADAFLRHAGIDLLATIDSDGVPDRDALAGRAASQGHRIAADDSWSDIFSRVLVAAVEPHLGIGRATVLDAYPICEAALARPSTQDARLAERFELYACGVELANAFGELTDPVEQRRRFETEMAEKARLYGERYPIDEEFLEALAHMPPASGIALGFDRLVMLATGARRIEDVMWAPVFDPWAG